MRLKWTTCTFAVLPGNHLCSFHALGLPDNANSFLRIVQVLQQHTDGVVPVSGASIGLESFRVPGWHRRLLINKAINKTLISTPARTYLLSACMALAYWRCIFGEEIFGSSSPTFNLIVENGSKMWLHQRRETSRVLTDCHPFLTSSWSECRLMQPCRSTGLSHRAELLQRIALRKKWTDETVFVYLVLDFQF